MIKVILKLVFKKLKEPHYPNGKRFLTVFSYNLENQKD